MFKLNVSFFGPSYKFTSATARKLMCKTFIFSTKCGVVFFQTFIMSIVFAILFKERKIDKSISITEYKRFDIVKMFHGMYPHTAIKHTKKVYLVLMQNSKVCLAIFVNFFSDHFQKQKQFLLYMNTRIQLKLTQSCSINVFKLKKNTF